MQHQQGQCSCAWPIEALSEDIREKMSHKRDAAAHLARLRMQFGARWRIDRSNSAYVAQHRATGRRITAASLPELETVLLAEGEQGISGELVMSHRGRYRLHVGH